MHHKYALYDSKRVTDGHWLYTASMATHTVLDSPCESYRGFVSWRYKYRDSVGIEVPHRNLLVIERTYISLSLSVQG